MFNYSGTNLFLSSLSIINIKISNLDFHCTVFNLGISLYFRSMIVGPGGLEGLEFSQRLPLCV